VKIGLAHMNKKAIHYFSIPYFCFATSQNFGRTEVVNRNQKGKIHQFFERALSHKMQLTEFCFYKNSKVHLLL